LKEGVFQIIEIGIPIAFIFLEFCVLWPGIEDIGEAEGFLFIGKFSIT
jgi:hypothetical protein